MLQYHLHVQAAFKHPVKSFAAADNATSEVWDWDLVKIEDKTLVHQVCCQLTSGACKE